MLNETQLAVIKQTVPVLVESGEALTRHFYQRMFRENPEVLAYFNPTHQREGTQQRALAGAICAYAQHIDQPEALAGAVELIAHKHVSLHILPEHYPIVGSNLLAAIREVLGEAASDAVIDAWGAAYGMLSDILIQREAQLYERQERDYGWRGFRRFVVARREAASDNIVSFYLRPKDDRVPRPGLPGQYITVRVSPGDGRLPVMRNYSLSGCPGEVGYRISVKRETAPASGLPDGLCSSYLHEQVMEGDVLEVSPPCGEFTLRAVPGDEPPLVLIAGGVGVTPLMAILYAALREQPGREVILIQCARDNSVRPFAAELEALRAGHDNLHCHVRLSDPGEEEQRRGDYDSEGLPDRALLDQLVGERRAQYYFCGPSAMMQLVYRLLVEKGVPEADMHYEFFGPKQDMAA